jgi:hypothetical protein
MTEIEQLNLYANSFPPRRRSMGIAGDMAAYRSVFSFRLTTPLSGGIHPAGHRRRKEWRFLGPAIGAEPER